MYARFNGSDLRLAGLQEMARQMDSVFNGFGWPRPSSSVARSQAFAETDSAYVVRALIPGATAEDVEVTIAGQEVTIRGHRTVLVPEGFQAQRRERRPIEFERTYQMPGPLSGEVQARLAHGLLTVSVIKAEEASPRNIKIELN